MSAYRLQVTSKISYNDSVRPPSPLKSYVSSSSPTVTTTTTTTTTTTFRPKAKVNSSATPSSLRKPAKSVSSPVRPPSPSKLPKLQASNNSTPRIRAVKSSSLRPQTAQSTPTTPILADSRPRFGSVSLHPDSYSPPRADPIFDDTLSDTGAAPRIRAKISKAAKHVSADILSLYPSKPTPSHRVRTASISSATSAPVRPSVTPRSSPSPPGHRFNYQPFSSHDLDDTITQHYRITPKVDPASIPLPPNSPPISAVSFSSRSSLSRSSVSSQGTSVSLNHNDTPNGAPDLRGTLDTLLMFNDADDTPSSAHPVQDKEKSAERKVMDEAKSNRKVRLVFSKKEKQHGHSNP
jgi:hypothetical protein